MTGFLCHRYELLVTCGRLEKKLSGKILKNKNFKDIFKKTEIEDSEKFWNILAKKHARKFLIYLLTTEYMTVNPTISVKTLFLAFFTKYQNCSNIA